MGLFVGDDRLCISSGLFALFVFFFFPFSSRACFLVFGFAGLNCRQDGISSWPLGASGWPVLSSPNHASELEVGYGRDTGSQLDTFSQMEESDSGRQRLTHFFLKGARYRRIDQLFF